MCLLTVVPGDRATGEALSGASAADGIGATGLRCEPRIPALPLAAHEPRTGHLSGPRLQNRNDTTSPSGLLSQPSGVADWCALVRMRRCSDVGDRDTQSPRPPTPIARAILQSQR